MHILVKIQPHTDPKFTVYVVFGSGPQKWTWKTTREQGADPLTLLNPQINTSIFMKKFNFPQEAFHKLHV